MIHYSVVERRLRYEWFDKWIYTQSPLTLHEEQEIFFRGSTGWVMGEALSVWAHRAPPEQRLLGEIWRAISPLVFVGRYRVLRQWDDDVWSIQCDTLGNFRWTWALSMQALDQIRETWAIVSDQTEMAYRKFMRETFAAMEEKG